MTSIKAVKKEITDKIIPTEDPSKVYASEETITDMVKNFRAFLYKERNVPQKTNRNYFQFEIHAVQYVANIMQATQALIEQDVIETDSYGFLTKNVTSFNNYNNIINTTLIPKAEELIKKKHEAEIKQREKQGEVVSTEEKELTPTQVAAIASEPTQDPNTHILEVLTTTGKRWYFDKVNYTLSFMKKDGEIKTIKLAKKGSWRATVINTFIKVISWIKEKYNNAKDRCIGIKQTFQFKMEMIKFNAKQKAEAKKAAKANSENETEFDGLSKNSV